MLGASEDNKNERRLDRLREKMRRLRGSSVSDCQVLVGKDWSGGSSARAARFCNISIAGRDRVMGTGRDSQPD